MSDAEKILQMMIRCGLATGHGDTIDDLIFELEKQINNISNAFSDARKEIERLRKSRNEILEEAALDAESFGGSMNDAKNYWAEEISLSIRRLKGKA